MNTLRVWGHTQRPWGYEVRADYGDEYGTYHEVLTWPTQPSEQTIADRAEAVRAQLEARMGTERAEREFERIIGGD